MLPLFAIILALNWKYLNVFKDESWKIANKVSLIHIGEDCLFNKKLIFFGLYVCTCIESMHTSHDESRRQSSELHTDTKYERATRDSVFMNFPRDTKHIPCITVAVWLTREFPMLSFTIKQSKTVWWIEVFLSYATLQNHQLFFF